MADPRIITLGCRLNAYESDVMRKNAEDAGLDDAIIVNTCAVTAEAVRQATKTIRRLRRENPSARIIVTGCAAQIEPQRFAALSEVDHVIGNAEKMRPETFAGLSTTGSERVQVDDIMSVRETAGHLIEGFGSRTRAYVQVQNGCDHRCTFCIIPFARGPSRSVPAGEIVAHIRRVVEGGCREVVLTGVDITSYGADLPGTPSLGALVRQILKLVPELERLRLSSIDQVEADAQLMRAIAEEERLMPHLHLSMQAGDDMVLKRMKRRHTRSDAVQFCKDVLRMRPDTVFGADLIAGFPDRDRCDVCQLAEHRRRLQPHLSARLPLLTPRRHARCAHAAGRKTRRKRAGCAAARQGRRHAVTLPRQAHQLRGAAPGREGRRRTHAPVR